MARSSPTDFNPRSPWGERRLHFCKSKDTKLFQSTLPVGGATSTGLIIPLIINIFQSTLPVGGATNALAAAGFGQIISIHAPRGGSDSGGKAVAPLGQIISIHAPRGGGATCCVPMETRHPLFQSTLPVGGATSISELWV